VNLLATAREGGVGGSDTLLAALASPGFRGHLSATDARRIRKELGYRSLDQVLTRLVSLACAFADAPISGDKVGAVVQAGSGDLYFGFNTEYLGLALSSCVHAEQAALVNAWSNGETTLRTIAISAPPCGHCRQFLSEVCNGREIGVLFPGSSKLKLGSLIPHPHEPKALGVPCLLATSEEVPLLAGTPRPDHVIRTALKAARLSHAPYSKGYAGVALRTQSGLICAGRYAENAAFNPSLPPMAAALVMWRLSAVEPKAIARAVLVAVPSLIDHIGNSAALLAAVSEATLEVVTAVRMP
jgi:cytidine deaminase